jgi:hypothetical protein
MVTAKGQEMTEITLSAGRLNLVVAPAIGGAIKSFSWVDGGTARPIMRPTLATLAELRDSLPADSDAELRLRGDEVFGQRITISYFREQTDEEAELEQRYAAEAQEAKERELARLQAELGVVCYAAPGKRGKLRIVA